MVNKNILLLLAAYVVYREGNIFSLSGHGGGGGTSWSCQGGWGAPPRKGKGGLLPSGQDRRVPPSSPWTGYATGGTPLAVTQERFLERVRKVEIYILQTSYFQLLISH